MYEVLLSLAIASTLPIVYSYVIYPFILWALASREQDAAKPAQTPLESLPEVSILMAAHNEERILPEKLLNFRKLEYPERKLQIFIGSDASTDKTVPLLEAAKQSYPGLTVVDFKQRTGKPGIINRLAEMAIQSKGRDTSHILILTDASIMLEPETLPRLVAAFADPEVALVDTVLVPVGDTLEGVSKSEKTYLSGESKLKHLEGRLWGVMMGPFGGCFAVRSSSFHPVPANFLVDDFFIAMKVLEQGSKAVSATEAVVREPATHDLSEEFRRKVRISAGNFQNLAYFRHLWWPPLNPVGFAFFSHKILRWTSPLFMLLALASLLGLACLENAPLRWIFAGIAGLCIALPLLDRVLGAIRINFLWLRNVSYFIWMNLALGLGFIKYLKGVKTNVWQPTKRSGDDLSTR